MNFKREHKLLSVFAYSSLTDIVFLLIIFFLLTSSFVIQPGIKVQLPKAEQAEQEPRGNIVISITEKGSIYLNDELVSIETLGGKLALLLPPGKEDIIVINADRTVSLQNAVQVMDIAKGIGATRLLIATQPTM